MSRGLGFRQRQVLAALRQLELEHGEGSYSVRFVLQTIAAIETKDAEKTKQTFQRNANLKPSAEVTHQATKITTNSFQPKGWRNVQKKQVGEQAYPSRLFALLVDRGLLWESVDRGTGTVVGLTAAGRAAAAMRRHMPIAERTVIRPGHHSPQGGRKRT